MYILNMKFSSGTNTSSHNIDSATDLKVLGQLLPPSRGFVVVGGVKSSTHLQQLQVGLELGGDGRGRHVKPRPPG